MKHDEARCETNNHKVTDLLKISTRRRRWPAEIRTPGREGRRRRPARDPERGMPWKHGQKVTRFFVLDLRLRGVISKQEPRLHDERDADQYQSDIGEVQLANGFLEENSGKNDGEDGRRGCRLESGGVSEPCAAEKVKFSEEATCNLKRDNQAPHFRAGRAGLTRFVSARGRWCKA
jgi:hypothetical protein